MLAAIAVLASLVAPDVTLIGDAKNVIAPFQIEMLGTALDPYGLDHGRYVRVASLPPPSAGVSVAGRAQGDTVGFIGVFNASGRSGAYYLPDGARSQPTPLLVILHGTGQSGQDLVFVFYSLAQARHFAIADVNRDEGAGDFVGILHHAGAGSIRPCGEDFGVAGKVDAGGV